MHLLQDIEINNFLNLKSARLEKLMDLNVIIGPNNCGKTSILRGIALLQRISIGKWANNPIACPACSSLYTSSNLFSVDGEITEREKFLYKHDAKFMFTFTLEEIERVLPYLINERNKVLEDLGTPENDSAIHAEIERLNSKNQKDVLDKVALERLSAPIHAKEEFAKPRVLLRQVERHLKTEHLSFLLSQKFSEEVLKTIIFCPDARLDTYKGMSVPDYIRSKNFPATEQTVMINFLKDFVDLKLADMRQNMDLIRIVEDRRFDTTIAEQGSGVKSLICLVADILAGSQNKILLIDEPELGLNPAGKQALLRFLLGQCGQKQVFITTHDPTFVNPLLWGNQGVSVYLYSVTEGKFVRINLNESKIDPNTFAGYLPHTTSLKKVHLYVEGSLDVYIFQIFLERYLKENFENWWEIINSVGIYHLAGDFWSHLLYTIPDRPYFSIVILDGDKTKIARNVVEKYDKLNRNFKFFNSISEIRKLGYASKSPKTLPFPVYCLERSKIEEYLEPKPALKAHGPLVAESMNKVPEEIAQLFSLIFKLARVEGTIKSK